MSFPQKYYTLIFFVMRVFTLRLLKIIEKNDSVYMRFVFVARGPEGENQ